MYKVGEGETMGAQMVGEFNSAFGIMEHFPAEVKFIAGPSMGRLATRRDE